MSAILTLPKLLITVLKRSNVEQDGMSQFKITNVTGPQKELCTYLSQ